jgi:hypothetical protein
LSTETRDTPLRSPNRPGLPAINYRLGTQSIFLRRMLERLPYQEIPGGSNAGARPLLSLTTRSTTDPSIALLDAWACVADVLTFYQERIANEGFLRTAVERRSIMELANAIGYQLKPGVAASTYLVFTVENAPGAPGVADIPAGTRVLSIPAQNQKPQTFETIEEIEARKEWNTLKPRITQPQDLAAGTKILYLKGTSTGLEPGDAILLVGDERERDPGSERWDFRFIKTIEVDTANDRTVVTWTQGLGERPVLPAENPRVYAFRLRAALFGHNAAEWDNLHADIKKLYQGGTDEWPNFKIVSNRIDLDASYPRVTPGSWVVLVRPNYVEIYKAKEVDLTSRTGFGLVSKVTRVYPDGIEHLTDFGLRETTVFAESEELEVAEEPLAVELSGDEISLDRWVEGLMAGRTLIFSGKRLRARASTRLTLRSSDGLRSVIIKRGDSLIVTAPPVEEEGGTRWFLVDRDGFNGSVLVRRRFFQLEPPLKEDQAVSEVASLSEAIDEPERTVLRLDDALQNLFDRTTVTIYANVAPATHGETVSEVLGSGNGTQTNQRFTLKKPPLTYVSAATASGVESTLTVRVNGVAWAESSSLYSLGPRDQTYIVTIEDGIDDGDGGPGKTHITFGDGRSGVRLPTGVENIRATYRSGIGLEGQVDAGSLTLLQTRPLGVRSVTNPLPASGAADPEQRDQARQNAPITVLTLDRIVSLKDFEDFTRAFSGIGKAQATAIWDGEINIVHVTAATAGGDTLDPNSLLYSNLKVAIDAARDPYLPVVLQGYQPIYFRIVAKVLVDERYVKEDVFTAIEAVLLEAFSFEQRAFGQAVSAAEVTTLVQGVEGVTASDLDSLYRDGDPVLLNAILSVARARQVGGTFTPAELLLLHPLGVELLDMEL